MRNYLLLLSLILAFPAYAQRTVLPGIDPVANALTLVGTVDADALLSELAANEALHFQAIGDVDVTTASANLFGVIYNGDATGLNPSPHTLPSGVQGFLTKNAAGDVSIVYTQSPSKEFSHRLGGPTFDFINFVGDSLNKVTVEAVGDTVVSYGTPLSPQSLTILDGNTLDFSRSAVNGWTPISESLVGNAFTNILSVDANGRLQTDMDMCGINEFIHNIGEYKLFMSHEDTGGHVLNVAVNGNPATFENLSNATDNGDGSVSFAGGANQNYNKLANTVESIRDPGEWIQFTTGAAAQFETLYIGISTEGDYTAHNTDGFYRILISPNFYRLFDPENVNVSQNSNETGTYRFTRSLYGFNVTRNGVTIYDTAENCENYSSQGETFVDAQTGEFRIGRHEDRTPIANSNDTTIVTGFDLTQATGMKLRIKFKDTANNHAWSEQHHDVDDLLQRSIDAPTGIDGSATVFDNAYVQIFIEDAATGTLRFVDVTREMDYHYSELWIAADQQAPGVELQNVGTITTTETFQNMGDPDPLISGEDFSRLHVQYGDNNRDTFVFFNGIARAERKGLLTSALEAQVIAGGQVQIRDLENQSGIVMAWYQHAPGVTRFNTVTSNPAVDINTIPQYSGSAANDDFLTLPDGRSYTLIGDDSNQTEITSRSYDGVTYPFAEIEVVKDAAAAGGLYLRANSTGGRQSQVRMSVVAPATFVANSGANTALPTVLRELETEYTIRYLVQFNEAANDAHTDLEIAPVGTELDLTIAATTPPLTGTLGVVGVTLFGANPL